MPDLLSRAIRNVSRFPSRAVRTVQRRLDPVYKLERQALAEVPVFFGQGLCDQLGAIPGTSSQREGMLLAHLAMRSPPGGVFVEIGAFKGKTTAWLVEAAEHHSARPTVVSIDPHLGTWYHPDSTWTDFQQTVACFQLKERGPEIRREMSSQSA